MKTMQSLIFITVVALFTSCATTTPPELINARAAYLHASQGPAAELAPAELHKAHNALIRAEQSFADNPDSYKTRDLAYVAQRMSQLAGVIGSMAVDKAAKAKADAAFEKKQTALVKEGKENLAVSEKETADAQKATAEAEKKTAEALAELAKLAAVKEEERGLVITLSGSVLFQSAQSTLMPTAMTKLDQVVTALMAVRERNILVEGHTDSQGSDGSNQTLSQGRADAVRNYIVQRGYPSDRIKAQGRGEGSPVADNGNAEGRANNRRVEIIIERPGYSSK